MEEKIRDEELKEVAGGSTYEGDWEITCASCGTKISFCGFQQVIYCPKCRGPIYVVHGEGNPHRIKKTDTPESAS